MYWILAALGSSAIFGWMNIADRILLSRHFPIVSVFFIWEGIFLASSGTTVLLIAGIPDSGEGILLAYLSGLIWGAGLMCVFLGFRIEEASRAVAIYQTFPVFVAILALIFLDEMLNAGQWVGILAVVVGAVIISFRGSLTSGLLRFNRALPVLVASSFLIAVGLLISKPALDLMPVYDVFMFRSLGMACIFFLFFRPAHLSGLRSSLKNRRVMGLFVLAELVGSNIALSLVLIATDLGPVSLVSSLMATRPLFVFAYSTFLSTPKLHVLDEPLKKEVLLQKSVAVAAIIGGVCMVSLW